MRTVSALATLIVGFGGILHACEECQAFAVGSLQAVGEATTAVERWSDPASWGGALPAAGADVTIPTGVTMLLDTTTPVLGGLLINGALVFADTADRALSARWIAVMGTGSRLEVGTEARPFTHRAVITLHGSDETQNVFGVAPLASGTKFLMVGEGGTVDLHGASRAKRSWTVLAADQAADATSIQVADATGWTAGDRLGFAAGDGDPRHIEERTVTAVSADGRTVTLDRALTWPRSGRILDLGGAPLDTRTEVALLTHRIVVQGAPDSDASRFGMHGMVMPGGTARIEGVEFTRCGQLGHHARYPWHWHLVDRLPAAGVTGAGQYIRDCAVHHSFHRAYAVHGTNDVRVERCVAFDVTSHAFVIGEEGDERATQAVDNLAVGVHMVDRADLAFPRVGDHVRPSLQNEHRAAGFWMSTANNVLVGNRAASIVNGNGFFFDRDFTHESALPRTAFSVGVFQDNLAHNVILVDPDDHYVRTEVTPTYIGAASLMGVFDNGLFDDTVTSGAGPILRGTTTYDCNVGLWLEGRHVTAGSVIADCTTANIVRDGVMVGTRIGYRTHLDRPWVALHPASNGHAGFRFEDFIRSNFRCLDLTLTGSAREVVNFNDEDFIMGSARFRGVRMLGTWQRRVFAENTTTPENGRSIDEDGSLTGRGTPTAMSLVPVSGATRVNDVYLVDAGTFTRVNQPPVAKAGADRTLTLPAGAATMAVSVSDAGSADSDGTITAYAWSIDGRQIASSASATIQLGLGQHIAALRVTDNGAAADQHAVRIRVLPNGSGGTPDTTPPTAPTGLTAEVRP